MIKGKQKLKERTVKVFAPATIANIGPAFDILGVAIEKPGDYVVAKRTAQPGLSFVMHSKVAGLPVVERENVAAFVANRMLQEINPSFGVHLTLYKEMPVGSGLGSSAASSVAAAVAVNSLLEKPLSKRELIPFAMEGERKASGAAHADNAAPALLGGICLVANYHPLDIVQLPLMANLIWVVIHPHIIVSTAQARKALPSSVRLATAVQQWGKIGGLITGLVTKDVNLIGRSISDHIVEPARAKLIPGFNSIKQTALVAGALGCSISGSGPSIFALTTTRAKANRIASAMQMTLKRETSFECDIYISRTNNRGAHVVKMK
jgi:homoserine kinase